ncbi:MULTISPECIES: class II aldolase/adducin family protein [Methylophaga]|jgi:L-fuculose-phosphate aldolase|uniref:Class II aldolase/adducin family protein n=1 Tax=Methylophaga marina TaxID=45495 RepID=A0ABP3DBX9_9GAMM|nr:MULTISPECIES: class II aldolase/adducin family protein [Methylophaga]BDZ74423.1 aldolase [Methylophaga marina]|tara:strand:+ start:577 stop:1146 length:570 start_codon:yes stop_codon:yes gene_type:complete
MSRLPDLHEQKQALVQHYKWLRQYGCNDSHSGNASFRWHNDVWVTPTGCCADTLSPDDLVRCHLDGHCGEGASLDAPLHIAVYQQNDKTRAVFHSHGPHAVAMTLTGDGFTPIDFEGQYYFPVVPIIHINYAEYVEKAPAAVAQTLKKYKVTVVSGHGVYACAETINLAYKWTCSLELSAKTAWLAKQI